MKNFIKLFALTAFTSSLLLFSQDISQLDEDFLQSLPKEVRDNLIEEINAKKSSTEEKVFKAPSSTIQKPEEEKSDKFGLNFFRTMQTSFMPINEPTFDPNYIIGVGDELKLQFTGQKDLNLNLTVNRDGSINLPEIGKLFVAGLSLQRVDALLLETVKQAFIGVQVFTTLSSIRDMQILVVGEAAYPGVYTLPGNATILNVLSAAGGFNEEASLRQIKINREGKTVRTIDLYDAFIYGNFSKVNEPLKPGDTIFIDSSKFEIRIQGGVRRPGIYELLEQEGYADLLFFANGYTNAAKKDELQLSRISNESITYNIYDDQFIRNIKLLHEDIISIQSIDTILVEILGAVSRPGSYLLPQNANFIDLIDIAGGYNDNAYPFGGIYTTNSAKSQEALSLERIRKDLVSFLTRAPLKSGESNYDISLINKEYTSLEPLGRVSLDLNLNSLRTKNLNFSLQDEDTLFIPVFQNIIHVFGDVENPGSFVFQSGKSVLDYIKLAGGKKESASDKVILYHPNGESEIFKSNNNLLSLLGNNDNHLIFPGSLIFIPREFNLSTLETSRLYLPIVSNLAVTMASIASISSNN